MNAKKDSANTPSMYTRSINLIEDDPLEEIFALNLGDFLTEQLINPELVQKISKKVKEKDKRKSLKEQLFELISIYSIDNTLSLLGFENNEDFVIYNSIAKTIKLILNLSECNIFLCKKNEPLRLAGVSEGDITENEPADYIKDVMKKEEETVFEKDDYQY